MSSVFIVWHTYNLNDASDEKLIGVYANRAESEAAIGRLTTKDGFRDAPDGFEISEYQIGVDHWTEGYVSEAGVLNPPAWMMRKSG